MPLYEKLLDYSRSGIYPFHMPGHKRNPRFFPPASPLSVDVTETEGTDNLHRANGIIKEAMDFAAEVFSADSAYFLVNGASCGIIAAVTALCGEGDTIIAARNYHRAFVTALIYSGAKPVYVMPEVTDCCLIGGIDPAAIADALSANPAAKAVYITSPTYEGFTSDIRRIAGIVHAHNKILIVDAAHGAHFAFSDYFPESAVSAGADIVIESVHKTLPAPTQAALLHVKGDRADKKRLEEALAFTQTSSPSYILMSLIDSCIRSLVSEPEIFELYIKRLKAFREQADELSNIRLLGAELKGRFSIRDIDRGKLTFTLAALSGKEMERNLLNEHRIQIEMSGRNHIIAMTSPADTDEGFERLITALGAIDKASPSAAIGPKIEMNEALPPMIFSQPILPPREAWRRRSESVKLAESAGRVCAEGIIPYPPGIPLVAAGEVITREAIELINIYKSNGIALTAMRDKNAEFVTVIKNC